MKFKTKKIFVKRAYMINGEFDDKSAFMEHNNHAIFPK